MKQLITILAILCCGMLYSQVSLFEQVAGDSEYVQKSKSFTLLTERLQEIKDRRPQTLDLLIDGVVIELQQAHIGDYVLRTETKVLQRTQMLFYRGSKSIAAVSIINDDITVMYVTDGVYRLHRVGEQYLLYRDRDVLQRSQPFTCGVTQSHVLATPAVAAATGNCVEVYFECDFAAYKANGMSVAATEAWVATLFNEVATLYANEGIPVAISDIKVWTSTDPYAALNSIGAILDEFVMQTITNGYDGRLAHLLSTRPLGGGIAYVNVLCHSTRACGVSTSLSTNIVPFPNYSWNVEVVTHELGHNFGSRHTHDCVWNGNMTQIDDCGSLAGDVQPCYDSESPIIPADGTIMSYCHLVGVGIDFTLGFGPQPGSLILSRYLTASCVTGTCPVLPIGVEQFDLRVDACVVHLRWIADSPTLWEGDGETWTEIVVDSNGYVDHSPSKFYRLESDGEAEIITNYDLCVVPYHVIGSTLIVNQGGHYHILGVDGKTLYEGSLVEGWEIRLPTGAWIVVVDYRHVEIITVP